MERREEISEGSARISIFYFDYIMCNKILLKAGFWRLQISGNCSIMYNIQCRQNMVIACEPIQSMIQTVDQCIDKPTFAFVCWHSNAVS